MKNPVTLAPETDLVARDARGRWGSPRTLVEGGAVAPWAPDGKAIATFRGGSTTPLSLEVVHVGGGESRVLMTVRDPATDVAPIFPYLSAWSADGLAIYFLGRDPKDRSLGIWRVPVAGGTPQLAMRFDDPARPWHQNGFRVHGGRFYFTLGDRQSDVWTAEIVGSR